MIKKTEQGFSVEVETGGDVASGYLNMLHNLIDLLEQSPGETENYPIFELLRAMMPNYDDVKTMLTNREKEKERA